MIRIILSIIFVSATLSLAKSCNYSSQMNKFDKNIGFSKLYKGINAKKIYDEDDVVKFKKVSKPMQTGPHQNIGKIKILTYRFDECSLSSVNVQHYDPDEKDTVITVRAVLRDDGTLNAMCSGGGTVITYLPYNNSFIPNDKCNCYKNFNIPRSYNQKYGCSEDYSVFSTGARTSSGYSFGGGMNIRAMMESNAKVVNQDESDTVSFDEFDDVKEGIGRKQKPVECCLGTREDYMLDEEIEEEIRAKSSNE